MIRDRDLHEVSGDSFVSEDWPRIFNRGADVEIFRLRIVGRNEIEAARILVVKTGRIHEPAGTSRLKCFRQLPDLERPEIIRDGYDLGFFHERDHLRLSTFVGFEE